MKRDKILKTLIGGALVISIALPLGISALANESDTASTRDRSLKSAINKMRRKDNTRHTKGFRPGSIEKQAEFESILEELVEDGILTSSQLDEVKAFFEENKDKKIKVHSEIVDQGILTQEQMDTIHEKLKEKKAADKQEKMQEILDSFVESGIITEDEVSAILDFISERQEERKSEFDKIKSMTPEEKKAYLKENEPKKGDLWRELTEEGIITEEQADSIHEKLREEKTAEKQEKIEEVLNGFVEKGTITKENASDILDFIKEKGEERKAELDKIKDMTAEEKKAYFQENKREKGGLVKELVEAGIITEEQGDELSKAFPRHNKKSKRFKH